MPPSTLYIERDTQTECGWNNSRFPQSCREESGSVIRITLTRLVSPSGDRFGKQFAVFPPLADRIFPTAELGKITVSQPNPAPQKDGYKTRQPVRPPFSIGKTT